MFLFCDMFCFFTQLIRAKSRTFLAIGMNVILKIGILIFYHEIVFFVVQPFIYGLMSFYVLAGRFVKTVDGYGISSINPF